MSALPGYSEQSPLYAENLRQPDADNRPNLYNVQPYGFVEGFLVRLVEPLPNMDASALPLQIELRVTRAGENGPKVYPLDVQVLARSVANPDGSPVSFRQPFYPGSPLLIPFK